MIVATDILNKSSSSGSARLVLWRAELSLWTRISKKQVTKNMSFGHTRASRKDPTDNLNLVLRLARHDPLVLFRPLQTCLQEAHEERRGHSGCCGETLVPSSLSIGCHACWFAMFAVWPLAVERVILPLLSEPHEIEWGPSKQSYRNNETTRRPRSRRQNPRLSTYRPSQLAHLSPPSSSSIASKERESFLDSTTVVLKVMNRSA